MLAEIISFGQFIVIVIGTWAFCAIWKAISPGSYQRQKDAAKRRRKFAWGIAKRYGRGKGWF